MSRIVIDPAQIRQPVAQGALGLNVNFLADHAEMRARTGLSCRAETNGRALIALPWRREIQ